MKHGSLFSGIGGFDLAAEWMGWENVFHCEWNEFGQKVLKHYWPNAKSYSDITKTDFTIHRGTIDILTGGFPCQGFSNAGKRKGTEDSRYLWPEMYRAIKEIRPRWIVAENVYGIVNWERGIVFDTVCNDMEREGYEVAPILLPAASVGAIHNRLRTWFIAYRNDSRQLHGKVQKQSDEGRQYAQRNIAKAFGNVTDTINDRLQRELRQNSGSKAGAFEALPASQLCKSISELPQPYTLSTNDGLPVRLDGITFSKWRTETIKAAGNAVLPQLVLEIFKVIELYEEK